MSGANAVERINLTAFCYRTRLSKDTAVCSLLPAASHAADDVVVTVVTAAASSAYVVVGMNGVMSSVGRS